MSAPHHLPPRCRRHRNYLRGCNSCKAYAAARMRRRTRLRAYGQWQVPQYVPAAPVVRHILLLRKQGVTYRRISELSGLSEWTISRVGRLPEDTDSTVLSTTADGILNTQSISPGAIVVGVARRLQALTRAGYRIVDLMPIYHKYLDGYRADTRKLSILRREGQALIPPRSHLAVVRMYAELWDTAGPSPRATQIAERNGWQPFEAWTDHTIDDPFAEPFADPESTQYVDEVKVAHARLKRDDPRRVAFTSLTFAEQMVLYREWVGQQGRSAKQFRDTYRPVPASLMREMAAALAANAVHAAEAHFEREAA